MSSTKVPENGAGTHRSHQPSHKSTICIRKHSRHGVNALQVHKIQKTQTADTERGETPPGDHERGDGNVH